MTGSVKKLGLSFLILIGMFIPLELFLVVTSYLEPTTFVEKMLMLVLGYCVLGVTQLFLLFIGIVGIVAVWYD